MKLRALCCVFLLASGAQAGAADYCFGAVGKQCGGITMAGINFAACTPFAYLTNHSVCAVSAGSMTHDPCCADHPTGKECGTPPENPDVCKSQWNLALHRFGWGYQWARVVDRTVSNTTGNVVRASYCAKAGQGLHKNDVAFCCSRDARWANYWERLARPDLKICR